MDSRPGLRGQLPCLRRGALRTLQARKIRIRRAVKNQIADGIFHALVPTRSHFPVPPSHPSLPPSRIRDFDGAEPGVRKELERLLHVCKSEKSNDLICLRMNCARKQRED